MVKGIEKVVRRFAVQVAVYWGNPQNDGYGGFTFDDPVEVACRWEGKTAMEMSLDGSSQVSVTSVLLTQDVDLNGYLYLGTLDDLDSDEAEDPMKVDTAYIIKRFDKIPMVRKTDEFVRTAWLYETRRR